MARIIFWTKFIYDNFLDKIYLMIEKIFYSQEFLRRKTALGKLSQMGFTLAQL